MFERTGQTSGHSDLDLWPTKSNQFALEFKWMFEDIPSRRSELYVRMYKRTDDPKTLSFRLLLLERGGRSQSTGLKVDRCDSAFGSKAKNKIGCWSMLSMTLRGVFWSDAISRVMIDKIGFSFLPTHPSSFAAIIITTAAKGLCHLNVNMSIWGAHWNNRCCDSSWEDDLQSDISPSRERLMHCSQLDTKKMSICFPEIATGLTEKNKTTTTFQNKE